MAAVDACGLLLSRTTGARKPRRGVVETVVVAGGALISAGVWAGALGARSFDHSVRHDVDTMFARATTNESLTVTEGMLESLPSPVKRYLSYTGVVGKPIARTVHLAQSGQMRMGPGQPWLSLRAKQHYSVQPPGFVWDGAVRAGPVPIGRARDMYLDGRGSLLVKALSLFSVVDAKGEEIDRGAMVRYLSEMVWFPSAVNSAGKVYEYTRSQLVRSGSPTPRSTISDFPGTPLADGFDASGDLWVTVQLSTTCPQGCVVEFPRAELAMPHPRPTVTISSTGGANIAFTPSGDMWMVTGGGSDCYGTPCNNELEFTGPSSPRRVPPRRPSRSARLMGPCTAATGSPSTALVTCGSPTSTHPPQSSSPGSSFSSRGRPPPCGPSLVQTPG